MYQNCNLIFFPQLICCVRFQNWVTKHITNPRCKSVLDLCSMFAEWCQFASVLTYFHPQKNAAFTLWNYCYYALLTTIHIFVKLVIEGNLKVAAEKPLYMFAGVLYVLYSFTIRLSIINYKAKTESIWHYECFHRNIIANSKDLSSS